MGRLGAWILYHVLMWLYNIGQGKHPRLSKFMKYDCYALGVIFILELHTFGAWYFGNHTGYWRTWAYIVIPIMLIPVLIDVMAKLTMWVVKTNRYRLIGIGISAFLFWMLSFFIFKDVYLAKKFPDPGYFYQGIVRSDNQFWITFIISFILFFLLPFLVYFEKPEDE